MIAIHEPFRGLVDNPGVRRLFAVCLLVVFATLVTTDAVACPDGCQSAGSPSAADHCNGSGACIFCTGGVVQAATLAMPAPLVAEAPAPYFTVLAPPVLPSAVPDRPPRLT